jgi:hypothetical protein
MVFSIDFTGKVNASPLPMPLSILTSFLVFNQNFVVTGGNRGIGLSITRAIASAGGSVAILYRSSPDAEQVASNLSSEFQGQEFKAYKCDVTDQKRVQEVFQEVLRDFKGGMIHGVVAVSLYSSSLACGSLLIGCGSCRMQELPSSKMRWRLAKRSLTVCFPHPRIESPLNITSHHCFAIPSFAISHV